jgi:hypothetical protein
MGSVAGAAVGGGTTGVRGLPSAGGALHPDDGDSAVNWKTLTAILAAEALLGLGLYLAIRGGETWFHRAVAAEVRALAARAPESPSPARSVGPRPPDGARSSEHHGAQGTARGSVRAQRRYRRIGRQDS